MADQKLEVNSTAVTPSPGAETEVPETGVMTLREHLGELRDRLVKSVAALAIGMVGGWYLVDPALDIFLKRWCNPDRMECVLKYFDPTEGLMTALRLSFYFGLVISLPIILFQIIRFVAPGLTPTEQRVMYIALPAVLLLFTIGSSFAVVLVSPAMLEFLTTLPIGGGKLVPDLRAVSTINLAANIALWMGFVFQLPLVMFMLTWFGLVPAQRYVAFWRYAVVLIAVIAALITPTPDPVNMTLVGAPMLVLYFVGIGLARVAERRRQLPPADGLTVA